MPASNTLKLIITSEKVVNKEITTQYLPTHDQVADIFTKGLTTNWFLLLRVKLRVCSPPIRLRGDVKTHVTIGQSALPDHTAILPSSDYALVERCSIRAIQDKDSVEHYMEHPINCISQSILDICK
jgi:hypothetical protein